MKQHRNKAFLASWVFDAYPGDPFKLDLDKDGVACRKQLNLQNHSAMARGFDVSIGYCRKVARSQS